MSNSCNMELLTEAAGVKITMTPLVSHEEIVTETIKMFLKLENTNNLSDVCDKSYGFHLTKSKWDPYPWVGSVDHESIADQAGLRAGDCLLNIDGIDILGMKMTDIADLIRGKGGESVMLGVWRLAPISQKDRETGVALKGSLPEIATKLANAMSETVRALECPVCLESAMPPVSQCVHGHILCVNCRTKTTRCPICRVRLGQGRCLIAEKVHKVIRDSFNMNNNLNNDTMSKPQNLQERLFGNNHKQSTLRITSKNDNFLSKPRHMLLTKLFFGGLGKAASTENLTLSKTSVDYQTNDNLARIICDFHEKLNIQDRQKSASTGELSVGGSGQNYQIAIEEKAHISHSTLSVPATPTWCGSTDSISNLQLDCPLSKKTKCKEVVTLNTLLEHLNISHEGPQIHFHSNKVILPQPLPFGFKSIYLLCYAGNIFFFEQKNENVWMTSTMGKNNCWQWTLHGWGNNGIEIKLRRNIAGLEHPLVLLSEHIAPLPQSLLLHTIEIEILECQMDKSDL